MKKPKPNAPKEINELEKTLSQTIRYFESNLAGLKLVAICSGCLPKFDEQKIVRIVLDIEQKLCYTCAVVEQTAQV